jgi:hypothetical protein
MSQPESSKIAALPGINIHINIGHHPGMVAAPVEAPKPKVSPEVIKQRLENLARGRKKRALNVDIYPKVVSHNNTPETKDLKPTPRMGYYH